MNYPHLTNITSDDIDIIEQICEVLEVFKECTMEMSSESHVTISKIIVLQAALRKWCGNFQGRPGINSQVKEMATKLAEGIDRRFKGAEENRIFCEATLLDPRFKMRGFTHNRFSDRAKQWLIAHCEKSHHNSTATTSAMVPQTEPSPAKKSKLWHDFDETVVQLVQSPSPKVAAITEVDSFLRDHLVPRTSNPLRWWDQKKNYIPSTL